jgi:FkbM family methyltransferase
MLFSIRFRGHKSIPVATGLLKGKLLPKPVALENLSMVFGRYEPNVLRTIFSIQEAVKVAYDIGAHIGYMTLALAVHMGSDAKVFAFEPNPENIALIEQLIKQNSLEDVIHVEGVALADVKGQEWLIKGKCSAMCLLERALDGHGLKNGSPITVDTYTLDAFVFEHLNPPPDLIKIDVEGAEALVIQGSLRTLAVYSPHLVIEIHGPKNAGEVWRLLQGFEYVWWHLDARQREIVNTRETLLSYFSKDSWTQHFLLAKGEAPRNPVPYRRCNRSEL